MDCEGRKTSDDFAVGCNGNGLALMTYLGHQSALRLLGKQNRACAFDDPTFFANSLYNGTPWFLPIVSAWYRSLSRDNLQTIDRYAKRRFHRHISIRS